MKKSRPHTYSSILLYPLETLPSFTAFTFTTFGLQVNMLLCFLSLSQVIIYLMFFDEVPYFSIVLNLYCSDFEVAVSFYFYLRLISSFLCHFHLWSNYPFENYLVLHLFFLQFFSFISTVICIFLFVLLCKLFSYVVLSTTMWLL